MCHEKGLKKIKNKKTTYAIAKMKLKFHGHIRDNDGANYLKSTGHIEGSGAD